MSVAFTKPQKRVKERKQLQRRARLGDRGKTSHARRIRDFAYMGWVKTRPCLARLLNVQGNSCEGVVEAHHMFGRYGKDADRRCIPLCHKHHEDWTGRVGGRGIFEGWDKSRRWTWGRWAIEFTLLEHVRFPGSERDEAR